MNTPNNIEKGKVAIPKVAIPTTLADQISKRCKEELAELSESEQRNSSIIGEVVAGVISSVLESYLNTPRVESDDSQLN